MTQQDRRRIAFLYMRYCYRFGGLLDINRPRGPMMSTNLASVAHSEPWIFEAVLKKIEEEIARGEYKKFTPCDEPEQNRAVLRFVEMSIEKSDIKINDKLDQHLRRFCHHCDVKLQEGIEFFQPLLIRRVKKLFSEKKWKNTGPCVWP